MASLSKPMFFTMTNLLVRSSFLLVLLIFGFSVSAQEIDLKAYKEKYPGNLAVYKTKKSVVTIDIKNNVPTVVTHYLDEYVILDSKIIGQFSEEEIVFSSYETIENIDAYSLVPNGTKFKKYKALDFNTRDKSPDGSVFHDDNKVTSFTYATMTEGSVKYLEYDEISHEFKFPFGFFFKSIFPIEHAEFVIDADSSIHIISSLMNNQNGLIKMSEEIVKGRRIIKFIGNDIKPLKFEDRAPSFRVFSPNVTSQISYYNEKGKRVNVLESIEDLHNWYQANLVEVENEVPSDEIKRISDSITSNSVTELDKVKAIYYWVQNNIKYIAFEEGANGFIPRQPSNVCRKRFGDCKDMASLIYSMLKSQNITSYLTWVGTRDIPMQYSDFPSTATDNHMIAVYQDKNGENYFLDATSSYQPIEIPTYFIQDKEVLMHKAVGKFELAKVPILAPEITRLVDSSFISIGDNKKLKGKAIVYTYGYYNTLIHDAYKNVKTEDRDLLVSRYNSRGNNTLKATNAVVQNIEKRDQPLKVSFDFELNNYISSYDDEIYVNMILDKEITYGEIAKDREAPLELGFQSFDTRVVTLEIPEGYKVKFIPANVNYTSEFIEYTIEYKMENNKLVSVQTVKFKFLYLQPNQFATWNEFNKIMKKSLSESVVLKKK